MTTYTDLQFDVLEDGPFELISVDHEPGYKYPGCYYFTFKCNHGLLRRLKRSNDETFSELVDLGEFGKQYVSARAGFSLKINGEKWPGDAVEMLYRTQRKAELIVPQSHIDGLIRAKQEERRAKAEAEAARIQARKERNERFDALYEELCDRANEITRQRPGRYENKAQAAMFSKAVGWAKGLSRGKISEAAAKLLFDAEGASDVLDEIDFSFMGSVPDVEPALHGLRLVVDRSR